MSPNDVINARDNRDPFVSETELRRIPSLLARADLDLGFGSLQLVLAPIYDADVADVATGIEYVELDHYWVLRYEGRGIGA